jgi:hypothetical protein
LDWGAGLGLQRRWRVISSGESCQRRQTLLSLGRAVAPPLARNKNLARRAQRCLCQSRAQAGQASSFAINASASIHLRPNLRLFPSSAPNDLAAASLLSVVAITVATERLSSFIYRQSRSAVTPSTTFSLIHFSGRSDVIRFQFVCDPTFQRHDLLQL